MVPNSHEASDSHVVDVAHLTRLELYCWRWSGEQSLLRVVRSHACTLRGVESISL
jgi:hypothetical protein